MSGRVRGWLARAGRFWEGAFLMAAVALDHNSAGDDELRRAGVARRD